MGVTIERMPDEDLKERVNRELIELLNELRVALPGVQVLFAFLLILPFQQAFGQISDVARDAYFLGLLSSMIAIVFLIAPATYHRLTLRAATAEKEEMLLISNKLALTGMTFLGLGLLCSLFVVADVMFGSAVAVIGVVLAAVLIGGLWFGLPIWRRRTGTGERIAP
jgi:hypothetical protein